MVPLVLTKCWGIVCWYSWLVLVSARFKISSSLWEERPNLPSSSVRCIRLSSVLSSDLRKTPLASVTSPPVVRTSLQQICYLRTGNIFTAPQTEMFRRILLCTDLFDRKYQYFTDLSNNKRKIADKYQSNHKEPVLTQCFRCFWWLHASLCWDSSDWALQIAVLLVDDEDDDNVYEYDN